jgi:regulator of RNase E activity RraA
VSPRCLPQATGRVEDIIKICRIHPQQGTPPSEEVVAEFRRFPSTVVSDQLDRHGAAFGIHRITRAELGFMAGRAISVKVPPGDNMGIYMAIEHAQPGDVVVVDGGGALNRALMGEIFYNHMISRGIGGIVIDGCLRDAGEIAKGPMHVYARGVTHLGPGREGPADVHGPVSIGGAIVRTNDIIVGDADGVAVVPNARIQATLEGARALMKREPGLIATAAAGQMDLTWLHEGVQQIQVD